MLAALAEHDDVGEVAFLERHGFDSGEYFLVHGGKHYASKAVAGVAHEYATGAPLSPAEFSGGAATVQPVLERLGFEAVRIARRNPIWARDEVVLACALVVANDWHELRTNDPQVQQLSDLLRSLTIHPVTDRLENFRSPDAVSRKSTDLATAHPDYPGARTKGGRIDRAVIQEFITDPARMTAEAADLRSAALSRSPQPRRSGVADGLTAAHVDEALRECWSLGRDAFMTTYGGKAAHRYVVATDLGDTDALALLLGARALAGMDTVGPWREDQDNVARPLHELGFRVDDGDRRTSPEVSTAEQAVELAAGPARGTTSRGQGFALDQHTKVAVEAHAMNLARDHYAALGTVVDTALRRSWDYEVTIADTCWHVEVKGTTGDADEVLLTPNEVAHAKTYPHVALFIVGNITVAHGDSDERVTSGGTTTLLHPWSIDDGLLQPLGYKYRLPGNPV